MTSTTAPFKGSARNPTSFQKVPIFCFTKGNNFDLYYDYKVCSIFSFTQEIKVNELLKIALYK